VYTSVLIVQFWSCRIDMLQLCIGLLISTFLSSLNEIFAERKCAFDRLVIS